MEISILDARCSMLDADARCLSVPMCRLIQDQGSSIRYPVSPIQPAQARANERTFLKAR